MMPTVRPAFELTRRRIVQCGTAGLALPFMPAFAEENPSPSGQKGIATTDAEQRLTVGVLINGKGPYRFVVDTGADRSVLADDVATALNLTRGKEVLVQGVVRTLPSQTVLVDNLRCGAASRDRLVMPVLPRALLTVDGYLGLDVLDGCRVTMDFRDHLLEIGERRGEYDPFLPQPSVARIPVFGDHGHLRALDCDVGGVRTTAFIDTGAGVSVGNAPLFAALSRMNPDYVKMGVTPLTGVTGGVVVGNVTLVDRILIKTLEFSGCTLVIADLQIFDLWGLAQRPALLVGMNYLRQFAKVSIDYGRKELRFDLASLAVAMEG